MTEHTVTLKFSVGDMTNKGRVTAWSAWSRDSPIYWTEGASKGIWSEGSLTVVAICDHVRFRMEKIRAHDGCWFGSLLEGIVNDFCPKCGQRL